jgi:hypothetical protein
MLPALLLTVILASPGPADLRFPFYDWGACPFECCTYREWTANASTAVLKVRRRNAPVAFQLKNGEAVQGLTGVVVTTRAGTAKVFRATTLGEQKIKVSPGDHLLLLHYQGEGYWRFWFRGHIDSDQLPDINDQAPDSELDLRIVTHPRTVWWVKIRNRQGQEGWTEQTDHFDHMDACE